MSLDDANLLKDSLQGVYFFLSAIRIFIDFFCAHATDLYENPDVCVTFRSLSTETSTLYQQGDLDTLIWSSGYVYYECC